MARARIRIVSTAVTDPYLRYHGFSIDERPPPDFWRRRRDMVIGVARRSFSFEKELDLSPGTHTAYYIVSSPKGYEWRATIHVNDKKTAEGLVNAFNPLEARFQIDEAGEIGKPAIKPEHILIGIAAASATIAVASIIAMERK